MANYPNSSPWKNTKVIGRNYLGYFSGLSITFFNP